jgi:hypothetical protein
MASRIGGSAMPQALGGFILGAFAVFLVFFFDPGLAYEIQLRVHDHGHGGRYGDVAVGVAQPFAMGESYTDTAWYADDQDADTTASSACEEVIALENRSDHPLTVGLKMRYRGNRGRDEGGFEAVDGPEDVSLEPGERAQQTIRADSIGGDEQACSSLNRHGTLAVDIEACPEQEGGQGKCEQEQVDPADAVMHEDRGGAHGGDGAPRRDDGRPG